MVIWVIYGAVIGSFYGPIGKKKDEEIERVGKQGRKRAGFALIVTTSSPLLSPATFSFTP
jgi:hypothetical protein